MPSQNIIINMKPRNIQYRFLSLSKDLSWLQSWQTTSGLLKVPHIISWEADDSQTMPCFRHILIQRCSPTEALKTKEEKWNTFWNGRGKKKSINDCNYFNSHCSKDANKGLVSSCRHTWLLWSLRGPRLFLSTILT